MKALNAVLGGIAGACALTVLHQILKSRNPDAPRMDLLGMESLTKILNKFDVDIPEGKKLYNITLLGDLFSNAMYYSLAGVGDDKTVLKGAALGLAAGAGAVYLPEPLGLNEEHSNRTVETKVLTVGYYFAGGLLASGVMLLVKHLTANKLDKYL